MFFVSVRSFVRDWNREERGCGEAHVSKMKRSANDLGWKGARGFLGPYVVVYRPKDFLRRYEQTRHLPCCHLEVHLRELE